MGVEVTPRPLRIGFTGTRHGMTTAQRSAFAGILVRLTQSHGELEVHHGDCVGADEQAHVQAFGQGHRIVVHPPLDARLRAWCKDAHETRSPRPYLERDHAIVDEVDMLVGAPATAAEQLRSGTWATVRYARGRCRIDVIKPDGALDLYVGPFNERLHGVR